MIDLTKPVQTKNGRPVHILSTLARGSYPVKGYIGEDAALRGWALDGTYVIGTSSHYYDLENVPEYWTKEKEAYKNGKTIQFKSLLRTNWCDLVCGDHELNWYRPDNLNKPEYRIKPESVPLTKDDIKAGDIFLRKDGYEFQWTARSANAIMLGSFWRDYKELKEKGWKIKSLNETEWRSCEKEVSGE